MKSFLFRHNWVSLLTGTLLLGASPLRADFSGQILAQKPVAYWRLNETAATNPDRAYPADRATNSGSFGAAADGFYFLTNGLFRSSAGALAGDPNPSVFFTNAVFGSRVDVPYSPANNPSGAFTAEFWAYPTNTINAVPLSEHTSGTVATDRCSGYACCTMNVYGWWFQQVGTNNSWEFLLGGGVGVNGDGLVGDVKGGAVKLNAWQHVVGVFDGTNKAILYVNGAPVATNTLKGPYSPNFLNPLRVNGTGWFNLPFQGAVDEVAFYTNQLSAGQILAHYQNGANSSRSTGYPQLVGGDKAVVYLRLDEPDYIRPAGSVALKNLGSDGANSDGVYTRGITLGTAGQGYAGFANTNLAAQFNGVLGYGLIGTETNAPEGLNFSNQITLAAWIKSTTLIDYYRNIIVHGQETNLVGDEVSYAEVGLRIKDGYYQIETTEFDGTEHIASFSIPSADVGRWIFLAGTYDGTNYNLYRNGKLVSKTTDSVGAVKLGAPWGIGAKWGWDEDGVSSPTNRLFQGGINEVAIFTNALSSAAIQALYESVGVAPFISTQPQDPGTVYVGNPLTLAVVGEGSPVLGYQWRKGGAPVSSWTNTSLAFNSLALSDAGSYDVVITNSYGAVTSSVVTLAVLPAVAPSVTNQPTSLQRFVGGTARFNVGINGSGPLQYQWAHNGAPVSGGTNSSLLLSSLALSAAGQYYVAVTNPLGGLVSTNVSLSVTTPDGYATNVLADKPLAYWRLGETNGTTANDSWSTNDGQYVNVNLGQSGFSLIDSNAGAGFSPAAGAFWAG